MSFFNKIISSVTPLVAPIISPKRQIYRRAEYGSLREQNGNLYLLDKGVNPCVILIHGGGWQAGDNTGYELTAKKLNLAGYHVFAIHYRLTSMLDPSTWWNAQLQDCQLAVRWLRAHAYDFRIDPNRIGVMGGSAGGHLALMLGTRGTVDGDMSNQLQEYASNVQVVVDVCGPTNMTTPDMQALITNNNLALFGGKLFSESPELYASASPVFFVTPYTCPICIVHGTEDTVVPYAQAKMLEEKLIEHKVPYKLITHNSDHGMSTLNNAQKVTLELQQIQFMNNVLKPNPLNAF